MGSSARARCAGILLGLGLLSGCDDDAPTARAPASAAPVVAPAALPVPPAAVEPERPLSPGPVGDKLRGQWSVRNTPAARAKIEAELRKVPGMTEAGLGEALRVMELQTAEMFVEITNDRLITRKGAEVLASEAYRVAKVDGRAVTIHLPAIGIEQTLTFLDDDRIRTNDPELGQMVLSRR